MAARKEPSRGGKPDKLMRNAISLALHREAEAADGKKTKRLNIVAAKLVDLAMEGDMQAIKEINDRMDGKAVQPVGNDEDTPFKLVVEWASQNSGS